MFEKLQGNLLFHMRGKQAFSFFDRKKGKSVRIILKPTPKGMTKEESFSYLQSKEPKEIFEVKPCTLTLPGGATAQFAQGSIGAVVDNRIVSMDCEAVLRGGELYVPMAWFLRNLAGLQASCSRDGVYATDHETRLSTHITRLLRDLLKD